MLRADQLASLLAGFFQLFIDHRPEPIDTPISIRVVVLIDFAFLVDHALGLLRRSPVVEIRHRQSLGKRLLQDREVAPNGFDVERALWSRISHGVPTSFVATSFQLVRSFGMRRLTRNMPLNQEALAAASTASCRTRSTMLYNPLRRCGLRWRSRPNRAKTSWVSIFTICSGV